MSFLFRHDTAVYLDIVRILTPRLGVVFRFGLAILGAFAPWPMEVALAQDGVRPPIQLVEEADWPPFTPKGLGLIQEGLSHDLMRELFSRLRTSFQLEIMPQNRLLKALEAGDKDAVTQISKSPERAGYLLFSEPLIQKRGFIYFNATRRPDFTWSGFEDLKGLTIGIVEGHNYGAEFKRAIAEIPLIVEAVPAEEYNFRKLLAGRIDVLLSIDLVAQAIIANDPRMAAELRSAAKPYLVKDYHVGVARRSPWATLLPKIDQAILAMKADGSFARILARHRN